MVQQWDTHYHLYEETQQKGFILLGHLWWYNYPYARLIIYTKEKEAVNNKLIFLSACLPHLWEIASRQWGESEWHLSEQTQRSQGQLMRKIPCPHTTRFLVFYIPSVMLGERKTFVSADIISYWSEVGFPQVLYLSGILNLIKCSSFCAQMEQVRYGCPDLTFGSMKRDVWLYWTYDERHKHKIL